MLKEEQGDHLIPKHGVVWNKGEYHHILKRKACVKCTMQCAHCTLHSFQSSRVYFVRQIQFFSIKKLMSEYFTIYALGLVPASTIPSKRGDPVKCTFFSLTF